MNDILQDVRYGARQLFRSPGVSAVAVGSLALAIAANASSLALTWAFLVAPLPYPDQDRVVLAWEENVREGRDQAPAAGATFAAWSAEAAGFSALAAYRDERLNLTGGDAPEQVEVVTATPSILAVTGMAPALGRGFAPGEGAPGAEPVVILDHDFWRRRFAADPDVLGRAVVLDGEPHTVVGVMPPSFELMPATHDLIRPSDFSALRDEHESRSLLVMGRLAGGASAASAQRELAGLYDALRPVRPDARRDWSVRVEPVRDAFPGPTDTKLVVILTVVTLFGLLIACANVANLLLARAEARQKEVAVRAALGAGRRRIVRQLLTESLLLALAAGAVGTAGAFAFTAYMRAGVMPPELPRAFWPRLDGPVLGLVLLVTLGTGIVFGLAPALHAVRGGLRQALGEGSRGGTAGRQRKRLRGAFVVAEFAAALALLSGAAFLGGSFRALVEAEGGYEAAGVLTLTLTLPEARYGDDPSRVRFAEEAVAALEALPGITSAAVTSSFPRVRSSPQARFHVEGEAVPDSTRRAVTIVQAVTPGWFEALGVRLRSGRPLLASDRADAPPVVVVDRNLAERHLGRGDPLGRRIVLDGVAREVVGVLEPVLMERLHDPAAGPLPMAVVPFAQRPARAFGMLVRTAGDPAAHAAAVRRAVWSVDADQPVADVQPLEALVASSLGGPRVLSAFLAVVGVVALLLAAMGVYGVMAQGVAQQRREIGIRMAMGAASGQVVAMLARSGMGLAGAGLLLGVPLSYGMFRASASAMAGIGAVDRPWTAFGGIVVVLAVVGAAACWIPARRAAGVAPTEALRAD